MSENKIYYEKGKPVGIEWKMTEKEMTTGEMMLVAAVVVGSVLAVGFWLSRRE